MFNKKEFMEIKELAETICKSFATYEEIETAFKPYFTNIIDENSPRIEEFNKTYNILEIANAKSKKGIILDLSDGTKLIVDYYIYDKAPHSTIVVLNQMERFKKTWIPKWIDMFVKEN